MKLARLFAALCTLILCADHSLLCQQPLPTAKLPASEDHGIGFGLAVKVSTLGFGLDGGFSVTKHFTVRAGGDFFNLDPTGTQDEVNYTAHVRLHNLEGHLDWFPMGGNFHVSPGVVYYHSLPLTVDLNVPAGVRFALGDTDFVSNPANPITGNAVMYVHHVSPAVTVGWGNIAARRPGKHWSFPFEAGAAFHGTPHVNIVLAGQACTPRTGVCYDAATAPEVQGPLQQQIESRNRHVAWFKVWPIFSGGVAYRF